MASLVHRFHKAGWAHSSIAERNILVQPGPITALLSEHNTTEQDKRSFRLIDFGRSVKDGPQYEKDNDINCLSYMPL